MREAVLAAGRRPELTVWMTRLATSWSSLVPSWDCWLAAFKSSAKEPSSIVICWRSLAVSSPDSSSSSSSSSKSWPPLSKLASSSFNSLPPLSTMSRCSCTEVAMAARVSWPMICSCRSIAFLARSMLLPPAVQKTNLRQGFAILMHLRRSRPMPRFPGASVLTNWTTSSPAFAVRKAMEAVRGRESTLLLSQLLPHFLERLHVN
mmetsp:Transcript_68283/g.164992  ORF Transcript_68283/g.164992 Transcript_68283/m.164992 type:complete len:205 (+) Transcript_68283:221-835(+)